MSKQHILTGLTLLSVGGIAFAHHVEVALSHLAGAKVLDEVVFYVDSQKFGTPAYRISQGEFHHHDSLDFDHGDQFTVITPSGNAETITLLAQDFAGGMGGSIDNVHAHDLVAFVNSQAVDFRMFMDNDKLCLRGLSGGANATLELVDGPGSPLATMTFPTGVSNGSDDLDLELSIPLSTGLDLADQFYFLAFSATPGQFSVGGKTIPLSPDALFSYSLDIAGQTPGMVGFMNSNSDAAFTLDGQALANVPVGIELYAAYIVLSDDFGGIDFVSNRFTIRVE